MDRVDEMKRRLIGQRVTRISGDGGFGGTNLYFESGDNVSMVYFRHDNGDVFVPEDYMMRVIKSDANVDGFRTALYGEIAQVLEEYAMDDTIFGDKLNEVLGRYQGCRS